MAGFDAFDFSIDILTYGDGRRSVSYSRTPKQVVKQLQKKRMKLWVAEGSCKECIFTPERCVSDGHVREMERAYVRDHIVPECAVGAVAHYRQRWDVPDCIHCYAFYYQHWEKNIFLKALREAGLVAFWNMDGMETVAESGLIVTGYPL